MDDQDPRAPTIISVRNLAARSGQTVEEVIAALSALITKGTLRGTIRNVAMTAPDGTETTDPVLVLDDEESRTAERKAAGRHQRAKGPHR